MTTQAVELIRAVEQRGGRIRVEDGNLKIAPREATAPLLEQLRAFKLEIIAALQQPPEPAEDYAEDLRAPFGQWVDSECVTGIQFAGNLRLLLIDFCEWLSARNVQPCPPEMFAGLARELGCIVGTVPTGETLVMGLASRVGLEGYIVPRQRAAVAPRAGRRAAA